MAPKVRNGGSHHPGLAAPPHRNIHPDNIIINKGINGDTTKGVINRLNEVIYLKPNKIFIMIGINDIAIGFNENEITSNLKSIIDSINQQIPNCKIYLQSVLPVAYSYKLNVNPRIYSLNEKYMQVANENSIKYIDLIPHYVSEGNIYLNNEFCLDDGLHLSYKGYEIWRDILQPFININN